MYIYMYIHVYVCVYHLKRCKTSIIGRGAISCLQLIAQRRGQHSWLIWRRDAFVTYLPIDTLFWTWHPAKPRTGLTISTLFGSWTSCTVFATCMMVRSELQVSAWEWASIPPYGLRNLKFVTSLDHAWFALNLIHAFIVGIVFFIILRLGLHTTSFGTPLYLYSGLVVGSRGSVLNGSLKWSILIMCVCM